MNKKIWKDNRGSSLIMIIATSLLLVAFCSAALTIAAKNRDSLNKSINESDFDNLYVYSVFDTFNHMLQSAGTDVLTTVFVDGKAATWGRVQKFNDCVTGYYDETDIRNESTRIKISLETATYDSKAEVKYTIRYHETDYILYAKYFVLYNDLNVSSVILEQCDSKSFGYLKEAEDYYK